MFQKLKQYKIVYEVYNFFNKKYLSHNVPLYRKYKLKKKYYSSVSNQDFKGLKEEINLYDKKDSKEFLPENADFLALEKKIQDALLDWSTNGYSVISNFFSEKEVDSINFEIDDLISSGVLKPRYNGKKYMFANRFSEKINEIANGKMKRILEVLLSREVELFQTINFNTGSEQRTHSDSVHMTTFPKGNLIATWVALEDVTIDDGPLHYYPGSHKLPYIMNEDYDNSGSKFKLGKKSYHAYEDKVEEVLFRSKLKKKTFLAKKGDMLIWHGNLMHGGNKVNIEGNTRKSMVFHYYAKDVICYHEITQRPTIKGKFGK
ncbi:phytanoyl-CoA dioxygenase family protein [Flavicella marina]|uniref:phytanoyl-CoA dioxygenase family protein n=1 Tax=Flavicella marina TaxID=1475951 RepID=UPI0012652B7D|nr:phytanoyl-CoA dioxygenase family protein [Flavicella marina]